MNEARGKLDGYLRSRLAKFQSDLASSESGPTLLRRLLATMLSSGEPEAWQRRPSISDDGTAVVLSVKTGTRKDHKLRILVEPGSLRMTVAQQIAFALRSLDELLGDLGWRGAVPVINAITAKVFPDDPAATRDWRGGLWLGAEVSPDSSDVEVRVYLNLRHDIAEERWKRLAAIVTGFASTTIAPFLDDWTDRAHAQAIPVGIGIVIAHGHVRGLRTYIGVERPTADVLNSLCRGLSENAHSTLDTLYDTFVARFGPLSRQTVTLGYDFAPGSRKPERIKVDICCHLVKHPLTPQLVPWIKERLREFRFDDAHLLHFIHDVATYWPGSRVQFFSLGFTPDLEHATVYVTTSS